MLFTISYFYSKEVNEEKEDIDEEEIFKHTQMSRL